MIGNGMTLGYGSAAEGPFTGIANIVDVQPGKSTVEVITVSNQLHGAITSAVSKYAGETDVSDVTFKVRYAKAAYATIEALKATEKYWEIGYPDGATEVFSGFISEIGNVTPLKEHIESEITIAVSGAITFAVGA